MSRLLSSPIAALASAIAVASIILVVVACRDDSHPTAARVSDPAPTDPMMTMSTATSTLLGRATFSDDGHGMLNIQRDSDDWHMQVKANPAFDIAVQTITFQPGTSSGWHTHPGPVFIQVVSGTMKFYQSDDPTCSPIVRTAGQGFVDLGEHAHIARNESATPAQNVVTYFAPPGAPLRIDQPKPDNCPF
jgi:hypothetical protein